MTNRKNSYWIDRANERMDQYQKDASDVINRLNADYDKAIQDINQDIKDIFYQYAKSGDLTPEQTKRLLNQRMLNPIVKLYKRIIPHIGNEDIKKWFIAKVNSRAYKARITRLEAIKESIYANLKQVADVELDQVNKLYINNISKSYYYNMYDIQKGLGSVFEFSALPIGFIEETLKNKWSGQNYSTRIWQNSEVLAAKLEEVVTSGLMQGKSSRRMAKELEDMTTYGKFATERLIRTETTYVTNQGELESYKAAGIEKYIFVATLDLRTSKPCRAHDRKDYKVSEAVPGDNLPPLHPYCRSTTRAYIEGMKLGPRIAKDPLTGKTYQIDNMSYNEWYQKFVVDKYGEQDAVKFERMIKNKSSDRKQYDNYKSFLGKETPKTFAEFRELKYNNSEEWNDLKGYYRYKLDNPSSDKVYYNINKEIKILSSKDIVSNNIGTAIKPVPMDFESVNKHAMKRMNKRNITELDAKNFISNSKVMFKQTGKNAYYSQNGVSVIALDNKSLVTVFSKDDFDEGAIAIMEVLKRYE